MDSQAHNANVTADARRREAARAANLKEWAKSLTDGEISGILNDSNRRTSRPKREIDALVAEEQRRAAKAP